MRNNKSNIIRLSGVEPDKIDKQYGFHPLCFSTLNSKNIPLDSTKIIDLDISSKTISRTDELKNNHTNKISIVDTSGLKNMSCFWDRHPFSSTPIYLPIDRESSPKVKEYLSFINGKNYKIQDSINPQEDEKTSCIVDSIFCSTECALAYLEDNIQNPYYRNSWVYLREIYPTMEKKVAPHWRLLSSYGGPMTIEEFRKSFANITYVPDGVLFQPLCFLFMENYHL